MNSSKPDRDAHAVDTAIREFAGASPPLPLAVAFSGGADSTALELAVRALHTAFGLDKSE